MRIEFAGYLEGSNMGRRPEWVPLQHGVTAIYGLNGSGKTHALRGINELLEAGRDRRRKPGLDRMTAGGIAIRVTGKDENWYTPGGPVRHPSILTYDGLLDAYRDKALLDPESFDMGGDWAPELNPDLADHSPETCNMIREVCDHGYFLLIPVLGTSRVRSDRFTEWQVWPFAFATSDTPHLQREMERFITFDETLSRQIAEDMEANWSYTELDDDDVSIDDLQDPGSAEFGHHEEWYCEIFTPLWQRAGLQQSLLLNSRNMPVQFISEYDRSHNNVGDVSRPVFLRSPGVLSSFPLDVMREGIDGINSVEQSFVDVRKRTRETLATYKSPSSAGPEAPSWLDIADSLSRSATNYYGRLLDGAPRLRLDIGDERDLMLGLTPKWVAHIDSPPVDRDIEDLSRAQQRWALFAISLALREEHRDAMLFNRKRRPRMKSSLWLIDEPEMALHRSAETYLSKGLDSLASELDAAIIVATHSPLIMDSPNTHVLHARAFKPLIPLGPLEREGLLELGLRPSDLLNRHQVLVLVEGQHEKTIFEALWGDELRDHRIHIQPARGASQFKTVFDSELLFHFTDAKVVLAIDNLRADEIARAWTQARQTAQTGDVTGAISQMRQGLPRNSEAKMLGDFCSRALADGSHERFEVFGFHKPDITEYLPCELLSAFASWGAARRAFQDAQENSMVNVQGANFKEWLTRHHGADFSDSHLIEVTRSLDSLDQDFSDFYALLLTMSADS